jgi:hypothetical protein
LAKEDKNGKRNYFKNRPISVREKKYPFTSLKTEDDSDLVFVEYAKNVKVDLALAKELVANRIEFTDNKPCYVVIDITNIKQIPAEAKAYMQHPEGGLKNILGAAFVANNRVAALIANIFIKTPKDFEAKFFHTKEEAVRWIKECKAKKEQDKD